MNFKSEYETLMSSAGGDGDSNDSDSLKLMRVNDMDIQSAVDDLESSENEDLENEKDYSKNQQKP